MKHNHRHIRRESYRIAFQLPTPYPEEPFKVWRIRATQVGHSFQLEGLVLESAGNGTRAVVAHARAGDVVMITHHPKNGITPPHRGFLIGKSFEPIPLDNLSPYFGNHTTTNGPVIDYDGKRFIHFRVDDLRGFMRAKHPDWLEAHVDATLRLWRTEASDLFSSIAPPRWLTQKPWQLAMHDPRRALEQFPHLIQGDLGRYCIRRMLAPVSQSVAMALPLTLKPFQRFKNTEYLLTHHANDLSDNQLRICAWTSPSTALHLVPSVVDPRRRAILLSCCLRSAWREGALLRCPDFRTEVLDSLVEYFEEWMISHPDGGLSMFATIFDRLNLASNPSDLVRMFDRLEPIGRQALADYIAERV